MKSKLVFVFGVSQGLGCSIVEHYLSLNVPVIGVGRRNTIIHPYYRFFSRDLSLPHDWEIIFADLEKDIDEVVFIYNAGSLGEVEFIHSTDSHPSSLFQLNYFSWIDIVRWALNNFGVSVHKSFVSISSGAGRRGVPGWAQYGSSKAAMDNFMLTLFEELKLMGGTNKVYSLSPGVMNTEMQTKIRNFSVDSFPFVNDYRAFFNRGKLRATNTIAQTLIDYLSLPMQANVLIGVQDLGL